MRILLTGGGGFIGRNLLEHLSRDHDVIAPTHAELELADNHAVDAWFRAHEVDAVVHGAVRPGHRAAQDPSRQLWTNLRMFFNVVRNCDRFGRLVLLSSGAVYDTRDSLVRVTEEHLGRSVPEDEHGFSKYAIARYAEALGPHSRPSIVELRLFGVFGRYEDYRVRFISNAICRALCDLPITLRQDRRFSYLFIDDLMPVVDWAISGQPVHVAYNVAPDWTDSLHDVGRLVAERSGNRVPIVVAGEGLGREYSADNTRLRREAPDLRFTHTEVAIDRLFSWYADRRLEIDPTRSRSTSEVAVVTTVRVADFVVAQIPPLGVDQVFAVTGGGAMHLDDALRSCPDVQVVFNQHEQACAIAAEGYARAKGTVGVVVVTSGPGGTNCITGVLGMWHDSVPGLFISGQVRFDTTVASTGLPLRQLGDQEGDIVRLVASSHQVRGHGHRPRVGALPPREGAVPGDQRQTRSRVAGSAPERAGRPGGSSRTDTIRPPRARCPAGPVGASDPRATCDGHRRFGAPRRDDPNESVVVVAKRSSAGSRGRLRPVRQGARRAAG